MQQAGLGFVLVVEKDLQHFASRLVMQLLGVPGIGDRLLLRGVHEANMSQGSAT